MKKLFALLLIVILGHAAAPGQGFLSEHSGPATGSLSPDRAAPAKEEVPTFFLPKNTWSIAHSLKDEILLIAWRQAPSFFSHSVR